MDELKIFENPEFGQMRSLKIDGEPWFVGRDVALALGYANPNDALAKRVDDEDKGVAKRDTLGGVQEVTIINESGLYSLIFSSKLPSAKKFKHWVTSEVLPSIRKTGKYSILGPSNIEPGREFDFIALMLERKTKFNHYVELVCNFFGWEENFFLHGIYTIMTREGCDVERLTILTQLEMRNYNLSAAKAVIMDEKAFNLFCKIVERGIQRNNIPDGGLLE